MKRTKRVYISGPITGIPDAISATQFDRAEQELRAAGYKYVINPRAMFEGTGLTWDEIMVQCLDLVKVSDMIVLLPGWQKSRGVTMELGAAYALGIPVHEVQAPAHCDHRGDLMGSDYFNKERYYDPTAGAAISHVKKEERRKHRKPEKHKESSDETKGRKHSGNRKRVHRPLQGTDHVPE